MDHLIRGRVRRLICVVASAAVALLFITGTATLAAADDASREPAKPYGLMPHSDSAAVAAAIRGFHSALAAGDSLQALALLDSEVVILESGDEEGLAEYRAHHLAADIEFSRAVKTMASPIRVTVRGDVAWASSTSNTAGTFRGRAINSAGAELMVLARSNGGWRIVAIHWSSHARRAS